MPEKALAPGCKIIAITQPLSTVVRKREGGLLYQTTYGDSYGLHEHTVEQELKTMQNRHLFATPEPELDSEEWKHFERTYRRLGRALGQVDPLPLRRLLVGRSGRKKRRFYKGIMDYLREGISRKDAIVTQMQKLEFYATEKLETKEDRGIQFRSVKFNVATGRFYKAIEARLCGYHHRGPVPHHPVAKGLTPQQCCERLFFWASQFECPVFFLLDHSRFDAHVNRAMVRLAIKQASWNVKYDQEYIKCMEWGFKVRGYTAGGIVFQVCAKRKSGDIWTGGENSELNDAMLVSFLEMRRVKKYVRTVNGDDSYIIIEKRDLHKMWGIEDFMRKLGMVTEVAYTEDIWKVEFCQMRPCLLPSGITFVRNPYKVAGTIGQTPQNVCGEQLQKIVRSSALSELAMGPGCPVTTPLAKKILKDLGNGKVIETAKMLYKQQAWGFNIQDVKVDEVPDPDFFARFTMWKSWGIDPGEQEMLEALPLERVQAKVAEGKVKPKRAEIYEPFDDPDDSGAVESHCDCGACPTYPTGEDALEFVWRWI